MEAFLGKSNSEQLSNAYEDNELNKENLFTCFQIFTFLQNGRYKFLCVIVRKIWLRLCPFFFFGEQKVICHYDKLIMQPMTKPKL